MSGCAGGNRITRSQYLLVLDDFEKEVFFRFPDNRIIWPTGSYQNPEKQEFGDIDVVCLIKSTKEMISKQESMLHFIEFLKDLPDNVIVPFKAENKLKGKKIHRFGNVICVLFRHGVVDVQIDMIMAGSHEEFFFKSKFFNLTAEMQGLYCGLIRTLVLEHGLNYTCAKLGIPIPVEFGEYEFVLTPNHIELRIVVYDTNYKELDRYVYWESQNWELVTKLLNEYYHPDASFKDIVMNLQLSNERSAKRIYGLFDSMVVINHGEEGTEKGNNKLAAKELLKSCLLG